MKLVEKEATDRYNASEASRHPWVTRTNIHIPLTMIEVLSSYEATDSFKSVIRALVFLSKTKIMNNPSFEINANYKNKVPKLPSQKEKNTFSWKEFQIV